MLIKSKLICLQRSFQYRCLSRYKGACNCTAKAVCAGILKVGSYKNYEFLILLNMEILTITENKEQYMDLLLLGDEQKSMIEKYLQRGVLFALFDDYDLKTAAVVTKEDNDTYEIKNLATLEIYQDKGYGSSMVKHIIQCYNKKCKKIIVGTGDNERILIFYEKLGFTYSHTIKDFFIKNYDHAIIEDGKQLKDMIYYKLEF